MNESASSSCVIEAFAKACERLNDYAQELRRNSTFAQVSTGADIRHLAQGWCLKKWAEAQLNQSEGYWAGWWLEIGGDGTKWLLSTNLSISHSDVFFELEEAEFDSPGQLIAALPQAVEALTGSLSSHEGFRKAIVEHSPK